ncbi:MmgE/PrpD family protein [bacterium]|nr:MmgE/PrpD family protein [bacterium]
MKAEERIVEFIGRTNFEDIPQTSFIIIKNMILNVLGTAIAGSTSEGCEPLVSFYRDMGGREEATVLIHGGRLPAQDAAFVNSVMARALDYCDAMVPGLHIGSSAVPTTLAVTELKGGCSGKEFLLALTLGAEVSARLNLTESAYDGFDPTGICAIFASTVIAGKLLGLSPEETWNALALAFNRSAGSFQSNIDGSLAVRVIQGWVSQNGITCARFSQSGVTGPKNFLEGLYGYLHLYGRDKVDPKDLLDGLGQRFELENLVFKKYPSCGLTQSATDTTLGLLKEIGVDTGNIAHIDITVPPYAYKLVGHPFEPGENPTVSAQFSIQYCVANALLRGNSRLIHFEEPGIKDAAVMEEVKKVRVVSDEKLDQRGHTSIDIRLETNGGDKFQKSMDIAPGFPGNPLTQKDHEARFWDCMDYAPKPIKKEKAEELLSKILELEKLDDARSIIPLMIHEQ